MRIAYHPAGATLTAVALRAWITSAKAAIAAPPSPGVALKLTDPRRPYWFGTEVLSDDRSSVGGVDYSRVQASVRTGALTFNAVSASEYATISAWHIATKGGRIPFVLELPDTKEIIAVTTRILRCGELTGYKRWTPAPWGIKEWI